MLDGIVASAYTGRMNNELREFTVPRFLSYARIWTTSDRNSNTSPTTPGQWDLAKAIAEELRGLGLNEVKLTDHCYVMAKLPASPGKEGLPAVGFLAHMDTSSDVSGKDVKPQLVESYDGKPIDLGGGIILDPAEDPILAAQKGQAIIHTDGTTLLGADNKAGIAIIVGAVEYLIKHPEVHHGPIWIFFTPDEETGKGLSNFPMDDVKASQLPIACYTIDGGPLGELEWECFYAWAAKVNFTGISIHPGYARGRMVNAALMASVFAAMLPRNESPEATDAYYGYYSALAIQGTVEAATLDVFIRDFDRNEGERRIAALDAYARAVEAQFPGGKIEISSNNQYCNMKEKILARPEVVEKLRLAFNRVGVEVKEKPIRGGTDGSKLTEMGIPTPNIFTGGQNFHSRAEWLSVKDMIASCRIVVELIKIWSE